ncbi:hypothetical protein [Rudaea sp.]|uniref:hypothetical protein n=1 Tax=Rudaea sp. TaxID=2136325 RepID=UPI002ED684A6
MLASAVLVSNAAHAALYVPAAIAANYDVLVCQTSDCSFEHPERADYSGTFMLFAEPLDAAQLTLPGKRQYLPASMGSGTSNACIALTRQGKSDYYIGSGGLTNWSGDGATIYLNLGSGVDAGYTATLTQAYGDGLTGTGAPWGAGVAAPDDMRHQTIVARRSGKSGLSACPTTSTGPDPSETRRTEVNRQLNDIDEHHATAIATKLNASQNPRDWAVATLFERGSAYRQSPERIAKLERAMEKSNDPLVYWIALHDSHKSWIDDAPEDTAMRALPRLEPDNIAVWIEPLAVAVKRKDEAATAAVLAKMAAAARYDAHAVPILAAMLAAYQGAPVSKEYLRTGAELVVHLDARNAPYYLTQRRGLLGGGTAPNAGLPGLRDLFEACRDGMRPNFNAVRTMLCTHIARTLTRHSTTFNESDSGFYLLRELNTYDADDLIQARRHRWLFENPRGVTADAFLRPDAAAAQRYVDDLIHADSETTALRQALVRAGKPPEPPDDWPARVHPFLNERAAQTRRNVWGPLALWIARLTAPPGVGVMDAYY